MKIEKLGLYHKDITKTFGNVLKNFAMAALKATQTLKKLLGNLKR